MNRETMPGIRASITRKFTIRYIDEDGVTPRELKFYLIAGTYDDKRLGEVFIRGDRLGGFISGALDAVAMTISIGLQYGVPMIAITSKLRHNRFGPSGFTGDKDFPSCTSVFDLIAQFLEHQFPDGKLRDPTKKIIESSDPPDPVAISDEPKP
jgi:hypothetical protein